MNTITNVARCHLGAPFDAREDEAVGRFTNPLQDFLDTDTFARPLKTMRGHTSCDYIGKTRTSEPGRCIVDPSRRMPARNT